MFICTSAVLAAVAFLVRSVTAKTDIGGCVSTQTVAYGGASLIWYVPDTGEICEFLDCGGGRAPPKTTVPGCPSYEGTATYSPSYLPGFGVTATSTSFSAAAVATESSASDGASSEKVSSTSVTKTAVTVTSSAPAQTQTGSNSGTTSSSVTGSSSKSVSTGGAALPTGSMKGPIGIMAGVAVGVALM